MGVGEQSRFARVGRRLPDVDLLLDADTIAQFCAVVGDSNPAYTDDEVARRLGYQERVVPPSYAQMVALALIRSLDWEQDLLLDWARETVFSGEQDLSFHRPLHYNERLTLYAHIKQVETKGRLRRFDAVTISLTARGEDQQPAVSGEIVLLVLEVEGLDVSGRGRTQMSPARDIVVGSKIGPYVAPPSDRLKYIQMAILLKDPNPIHLDRVYARERGYPDVIQQGPLNAAHVYRTMAQWLPHPWALQRLHLRFVSSVFPGDVLTTSGRVTAVQEGVIEFSVQQVNQRGETTITGWGTARVR